MIVNDVRLDLHHIIIDAARRSIQIKTGLVYQNLLHFVDEEISTLTPSSSITFLPISVNLMVLQ